ncbi:MAG TPA: AbrB/MazE/SpoVT family DNA-binding domain-containing protein [Chloroflexota bacterium]|nr:AbrB/MazE/SpoVT family DNA-binding domain-containing protein [Chloroflexota bacterium]
MAARSIRKVVRPLAKGQITIPVAIRRALGITESSLLEVSLRGDKIVISKLAAQPDESFRIYSDEEIEEFLVEDKISPTTAERVRELMRSGLV